jgi:hypothetical protein
MLLICPATSILSQQLLWKIAATAQCSGRLNLDQKVQQTFFKLFYFLKKFEFFFEF